MAANLYIHKVFPHDLSHEVGFTMDIHSIFFQSKYYLSFTLNGGSRIYNITINDATDLRFGGDFKSMLPYSLEVGDFICIERCGDKYNLTINKSTSIAGKKYNMLLGIRQRHLVFENDKLIYRR